MANSRYEIQNNIKKLTTGNRVYKTILYPKIQQSENDIFIFSKQGDRLDILAQKYYGDSTKWWIISHANQIKGTLNVPRDIQLRIPMDTSTIYNDLMELNS